jgi:aminoglycoside phosphotransferase
LKRKGEQETKNTMEAEDVVEAIESMRNGERLKTLKLLHETYFYTRPFPSSANERLDKLEQRVEALEIKMGIRKEVLDVE